MRTYGPQTRARPQNDAFSFHFFYIRTIATEFCKDVRLFGF